MFGFVGRVVLVVLWLLLLVHLSVGQQDDWKISFISTKCFNNPNDNSDLIVTGSGFVVGEEVACRFEVNKLVYLIPGKVFFFFFFLSSSLFLFFSFSLFLFFSFSLFLFFSFSLFLFFFFFFSFLYTIITKQISYLSIKVATTSEVVCPQPFFHFTLCSGQYGQRMVEFGNMFLSVKKAPGEGYTQV